MNFDLILKTTQKSLFKYISGLFPEAVVKAKQYILVIGDAPVMLVAHLDTVHKEKVKNICRSDDGNILMSPQGIGGDDRCGVYALLSVYDQSLVKPWLLFTCDEEVGGIGASAFCDDYRDGVLPDMIDLKCIIEVDRKGQYDAVYYDCDNKDFEDYITEKGYVTEFGTFSDISYIAPELGVAAVNLSSGYYNAHTLHEYINLEHLNHTISVICEVVQEALDEEFPAYEYVEETYKWGNDLEIYLRKYSNLSSQSSGYRLKNVPAVIKNEYEALLDYYSQAELDSIRFEMGDVGILMLYESEFGYAAEEKEVIEVSQ